MDAIMVQSQWVVAYDAWLRHTQPLMVVTEYDRDSWVAPLILSAKAQGIPTATMIHGFTEPSFDYFPFLAETVFCWGQAQVRQFERLGVDPSRLVCTGTPRLRRREAVDSQTAKVRLGFQPNIPLAILATQNITDSDRRCLVRVFCEGLSRLPRAAGAVRLHPMESVAFYSGEIARFPSVRFFTTAEASLDDTLAAADILVCHNSTVALEALAQETPVVILDVVSFPLGSTAQLVEHGAGVRATSAPELADVCKRLFDDSAFGGELRARAESYLAYYCSHLGDAAIRAMVGEIERRILPD